MPYARPSRSSTERPARSAASSPDRSRLIRNAPPILANMPRRSVRLSVPIGELRSVFAEIRAELEIPESFPPEVLEEAATSAADPRLPEADLTDVPFVTIDPPDSMDLDQALHLESRAHGGFR